MFLINTTYSNAIFLINHNKLVNIIKNYFIDKTDDLNLNTFKSERI
jgi:hypothetical protein